MKMRRPFLLKVTRVLQGNATPAEKLSVLKVMIGGLSGTTLLAAIGSVLVGIAIFFLLMSGGSSSSTTSSGIGGSGGTDQFPEAVMQWKEKVTEECKKNEIPDQVDTILAMILAESGGNGEKTPDILQCSESQGWAPNTINDPNQSIEIGVAYFAGQLKAANNDVMNAVQAYNYGGGYLSFAETPYSFENAVEFAKQRANGRRTVTTNPVALSLGYNYRYLYGDMFYAKQIESHLKKYVSDGSKQSGSGGGSAGWEKPVRTSYVVTQEWAHIGALTTRIHGGIDVASSPAAEVPIFAARKGTVISVTYHGEGGNYIIIDHGDMFSYYGHFSSTAVKQGDTVTTDTVLGKMGRTGLATGIHLHFEVWKGAMWQRVSPRDYINF